MRKLVFILSSFLITFSSCDKNEEIFITKPVINGLVQKGPFLNGTSIGIYELNNDYSPTGKSFLSQILDNSGTFQINNVVLVSQYIQLKADGYYFNEITGQNSNSTISLYALTNIANRTSVNVNTLSHLEKGRIEYLISAGQTFSIAKKQAEQEILNIFSISKPDISDFDSLNIAEDGDNNAILLAISIITQGYRTESELSDLLANINTDIRQDGVLNSASLGSLLINDAKLLNLTQIRTNIEGRYSNLGISVTIPNFEKYIKRFLDSTKYIFTNNIVYPEFSNYGENILFENKTNFSSNLSMAANLPKGTSLKIILKATDSIKIWGILMDPNGPINWSISIFDDTSMSQVFTATDSGGNSDLIIYIPSGIYTIEYFENNSSVPTRIKSITVN